MLLPMTSFGFHYYPDDSHYRLADLHAWLPELHALGAQWLTLMSATTRAIPEAFIKGVVDAGITPIIHIPAMPLQPGRDMAAENCRPILEPLFKTYARWGVKYVALFSEPNTRATWPTGEWGKTGLVERFLDILLPVLHAQVEAELLPVFPALKAGGEYWDTGFLEAALAGLERRGELALARQLTFAVNLWTFNRPLTWGAGGLQRWPDARPYHTPTDSQDHQGFHLFDWYDEIIRARLGERRPFICLAGGPRLGERTDEEFPVLDEARHATCTQALLQAAMDNQLPDHLLNVNFWLLCATEHSPFASQAWYRTMDGQLPAVVAMKQWASRPAGPVGPKAEAAAKAGPALNKPLQHYLLLPTFEWGLSEWHWNAALTYIKTVQPTACGFSVAEAHQAQAVTIMGNEQGIPLETEHALRQAGCEVKRLLVKDGQFIAADGGTDDRRPTWIPRSRL